MTLKHRTLPWAALGLALGCTLWLGASLAAAQVGGGGYDLSWWTADGGGGARHGGGYGLWSTAGQPDAGLLSGGGYALAGGFWAPRPVTEDSYTIYLPVVLRAGP